MIAPPTVYRLRRLDVAKVVTIGLAQVVTLALFLLLTARIINAMSPQTVGAAATEEYHHALKLAVVLGGVAAVHGWLRAVEFSISEKIGYEVVRQLRMQMYRHLQGMTPREFQGRSRGGLLLRFVGDLSMLRTWISRGLLGGLVALIVLVGTLAVIALLNVWIAFAVAAVLFAGSALSLSSGRAMRSATRSMRRRRSLVMSNIDEQMTALPVVQVFGRSAGEYSRLSRQNDSLNRALFRVAELRGRLRGISSTSGLLAVTVVLVVGLAEVRRGAASLGPVLAIVLVTRQLNAPVRTLGLAHDYWHRAQVSQRKVGDYLMSSSRGLEQPGLDRLRVRRGTIEFRGVTVPGALRSVSVTAQEGQLVAVTGRIGAGKSTLLGLVSRLVEPVEGEVAVDGQVLASTTARSAARFIGVVSPELPLMRGTVRRNLTYSVPGVSPEELQRVILTLGLDRLLDELPDGLNTWVSEGGHNLSAGQRQGIALGRAMLGNPPILLLDEPTATLDRSSKAEFHRMLLRHQGTVLLATHDPEELMLADQVWCLERGQLERVMSGEEYLDQQWLSSRGGKTWPRIATS